MTHFRRPTRKQKKKCVPCCPADPLFLFAASRFVQDGVVHHVGVVFGRCLAPGELQAIWFFQVSNEA
eukprot:8942198-Lingulodinium_polyedra.AAC.1